MNHSNNKQNCIPTNPISAPVFERCGHQQQAHTGPINVVQYDSLSGQYVLTGGADKALKLWNAVDHKLVVQLLGHGWDILDVAISNDSRLFASCGGDKGIFVWDAGSATLQRKLPGHSQRINAVALNEYSSILASGSYDASVKLWDLKSNAKSPIQTLSDAKDSVTSISIKDHFILVGSVDECVRQYDIRFGQLTTDSIGVPVTCVKYSNDMQCMLVSGLNSELKLLDCTNGQLLNAFTGHSAKSYRITCALDYKDALVVCGSEHGGVCVWELASDLNSHPVQRLDSSVPGLAVDTCPKRTEIVTGNASGCLEWYSTFSE